MTDTPRPTEPLREIADAALTDFIYAQGSDFDEAEFPGMAALRDALASSPAPAGLTAHSFRPYPDLAEEQDHSPCYFKGCNRARNDPVHAGMPPSPAPAGLDVERLTSLRASVLEALEAPGVRGHGRRVLELAIERDAASSPAPAGLDETLTAEEEADIRAMASVMTGDALSVDGQWAIDTVMPLLPKILATLDAARAATRPAEPVPMDPVENADREGLPRPA